jgi:hypothetical protein
VTDPAEAIAAASSGKGHRVTGAEALQAFIETLGMGMHWVDVVETSELVAELEVPRLDLSIYGDHGAYDKPAQERRRLAAERVAVMLNEAAREPKTFIFQVWLDSDE